jgi:glycosyltransferase involved in cell wall biosynthesis
MRIAAERRPSVPLSVVICVRNRARVLGDCLRAVKAAAPAEVLIVDGASTDGTVAIATASGYRVVSDQGAGLGAARQLGAERASYPYVMYVDSDVILAPNTLKTLLDEAEANGWDALQAQMLGVSERPSYWQRGELWRRSVQDRPGPAAALGCLATLVRRELVCRVAFDPMFPGAAEDGDFFFRARKHGARIAISESAVAYHEDRRDFWSFARQRIWHGRGIARILVRHRGAFRRSATRRTNSARLGLTLNLRYLPFMVAGVGFLAIGLSAETLRIALDRKLAAALHLQEPGPIVGSGAGQ